MHIRDTKISDLRQLSWLYRQNYYGDSKIETDLEKMTNKYKELSIDDNYKFISVIDDDKIVGFCSLIVNHCIFEEQKPTVMLWTLRVHPDYRNKKIGKAIIEYVKDFCKSLNAESVFLGCDKQNEGAIKFYNKLNFEETLGFVKIFN